MILGFLLANAAVICIAIIVQQSQPQTPPVIQGVYLPQARDLPDFTVLDHQSQTFSNADLLGKWHLVSYGFTTCPDICPTTLAQLARVKALLGENADDVQVLFYTVDHQRDTPKQMASYVGFFHPNFIGLTHLDDGANPHLGFEQGLGISAMLTPTANESDGDAYDVAHGVNLLLLNPQGQLKAILKPGADHQNNKVFDAQTIYKDITLVIDAA